MSKLGQTVKVRAGGSGVLTGCSLSFYSPAGSLVPNNARTKLELDWPNWDPLGFLDDANDQAVVPAGQDGYYLITVSVQGAYYVDIPFSLAIYASNHLTAEAWANQPPGGVLATTASVACPIVALVAGDTIEVDATQFSGGDAYIRVVALNILKIA